MLPKPYFLPVLILMGIICVTSGAHAESHDFSTNNPALTGEPAEKTVTPKPHPAPIVSTHAPSASAATAPAPEDRAASLAPADLKEFDDQPEAVRQLITQGLALTNLNLSYKYGSANPKNGGMDCSGTVYYLLNQAGLEDVPRDASEMYKWIWTKSRLQSVVSPNPDTFELERLKPGDLLFWTGTYRVDRDPPVTHVMIYLGINRHTGHRVMVGASEGRTYGGKSRYGVSVFDFQMPGANRSRASTAAATTESELQSRFIGYGSVPGLEEVAAKKTTKPNPGDNRQ